MLTLPVALAATLGYLFGVLRDKRARRREAITNFLLQAYREIESSSNHPNIPNKDEFERAIAAIFLLGNRKQVEVVERFMDEFADGNSADTTELLKSLRDELRAQLGLEKVQSKYKFLRVGRNELEMEKTEK